MSEQLRHIGYICTSPTDHHPNVQAGALNQAGYTKLHETNRQIDPREALKELLDLLGDGDTLLVYLLDRLSRDEHSVVNLQQQLEAIGVTLVTTSDHETESDDNAN